MIPQQTLEPGTLREARPLRERPRRAGRRAAGAARRRAHPRPRLRRRRAHREARRPRLRRRRRRREPRASRGRARARPRLSRRRAARTLPFTDEFDAVFSNAALHWMRRADAVIAGVRRALKPGGRFVAEMGGDGCVANDRRGARRRRSRAAGLDAAAYDPWFFPTAEDYRGRLERHGFAVDSIALFPRPTPLPGDVTGWLETFAESFIVGAAAERASRVPRRGARRAPSRARRRRTATGPPTTCACASRRPATGVQRHEDRRSPDRRTSAPPSTPSTSTVEDESARHRGHAGAHGRRSLQRRHRLDALRGPRPRSTRHRAVYAALGDLRERRVHALALRTYTPEEWKQAQ